MRPFSLISRTVVRSRGLPVLRAPVMFAPRTFSTRSFMFAEAKEGQGEEPKAQEEAKAETEAKPETPENVQASLDEALKSLEELRKDNAQFKDRYARSVADFRNLQKTTDREMQKARDFALQRFSKDLIETVDNFDHALDAVKADELKDNEGLSNFYDGVKMTKDVLEKTLAKHGLIKIDPIDVEFDPNKHEAVFQVAIPGKEPGTVCMVQQKGYELNGRVLRAAKVGVAKAPEEQ